VRRELKFSELLLLMRLSWWYLLESPRAFGYINNHEVISFWRVSMRDPFESKCNLRCVSDKLRRDLATWYITASPIGLRRTRSKVWRLSPRWAAKTSTSRGPWRTTMPPCCYWYQFLLVIPLQN
jgi:hypothetical protein